MRIRSLAQNLITLGLSLCITLLVIEAILRISGPSNPVLLRYDPELGVAFLPGARGTFEREGRSYVKINADGLRDAEIPYQKTDPREYRIAVLGDSFVAALQVPAERNFTSLLAAELSRCSGQRPVRTINMGVPGYGTVQQYLMLKKAFDYNVDHVVLMFYPGNDLINNTAELGPGEIRPHYSAQTDRFDYSFRNRRDYQVFSSPLYRKLAHLAQYSYIMRHALKAIYQTVSEERKAERSTGLGWTCSQAAGVPKSLLQEDRAAIHGPPVDEVWKAAWQNTEALIAKIQAETQARGIRFTLVSLSAPYQVYPDRDFRACLAQEIGQPNLLYPGQRLAAFSRSRGISFLDLVPLMQNQVDAAAVFYHGFAPAPGTGHYNEAGHAFVASRMAAHLCQERP